MVPKAPKGVHDPRPKAGLHVFYERSEVVWFSISRAVWDENENENENGIMFYNSLVI